MNITKQPSKLEFPKFIVDNKYDLLVSPVISVLFAVSLQDCKSQSLKNLSPIITNPTSKHLKLILEGSLHL